MAVAVVAEDEDAVVVFNAAQVAPGQVQPGRAVVDADALAVDARDGAGRVGDEAAEGAPALLQEQAFAGEEVERDGQVVEAAAGGDAEQQRHADEGGGEPGEAAPVVALDAARVFIPGAGFVARGVEGGAGAVAADFFQRQRQLRAEFGQGQGFARGVFRRGFVGDGDVGLVDVREAALPLQALFFVRGAPWRGVRAHDDFKRVVAVGGRGGAQFGDLRPLPLAKPAAVFVISGQAVFVADEYRRVPEEADEAAVKEERDRHAVEEGIPGEPGAAGGCLL